MKRFLLVCSLLIIAAYMYVFAAGHEIKIKIEGLADSTVILGHHFNESYLPDDTIKLNKTGQGVFIGDKMYPGGMYFLFMPGSKLLDFFLDTDQEFTLETSYNDLQKKLIFKGCDMNSAWADFQNKVEKKKIEADELSKKKENASDTEKETIDEQLKKLAVDFNAIKWETIDENKDNFLGVFLKATEEVNVPEPPRDENGNIIDSLYQYRYYRSHYFDNFNTSDARLLRSPIYDAKIKRYLEKIIPQIPDTLIKEVDILIEASRSNEELFRYMLVTLLNFYAKSEIMGMDAVYLHIAEKYYIPEATWSTEKFITELKENVEKQKPLILGKVAPNIQLVMVPAEHFKQALVDTALRKDVYVGSFFNILDIKADFLVLYFWEADCGHCKKAAPALHNTYNNLRALNTQVVAVHMLGGYEGKEKWVDFINKNQMYDWINAWNPYSHDYKLKYDLKSTNQVYILNKNKEIIAKRISTEQIEDVIKAYKENEKKNEE